MIKKFFKGIKINNIKLNKFIKAKRRRIFIEEQVTPLNDKDYNVQLNYKQNLVLNCFLKIKNDLFQISKLKKLPVKFFKSYGIDLPACTILKIEPSVTIDGYRNNCDFSIGYNYEGNKSIGFRNHSTLYRTIGNINKLRNVPIEFKTIINKFEEYIRNKSKLDVFYNNSVKLENKFWREVLVRKSDHEKSIMIVIQIIKNESNFEEAIKEIKLLINELLSIKLNDNYKIKSIFLSTYNGLSKLRENSPDSYKLIYGEEHLLCKLNDIKLRLSHDAFFQVNTFTAEKLYKILEKWIIIQNIEVKNLLILDIYCGTGSIGLTLAKYAKKSNWN